MAGEYEQAMHAYSKVAAIADQKLDLDTYLTAEIEIIRILNIKGSRFSALEELKNLEEYLETYPLLSEEVLFRLAEIRIETLFNLTLLDNIALEIEHLYNLGRLSKLDQDVVKSKYLLLRARVSILEGNYKAANEFANSSIQTMKGRATKYENFYQNYIIKSFLLNTNAPFNQVRQEIQQHIKLAEDLFYAYPKDPLRKAIFKVDKSRILMNLLEAAPEQNRKAVFIEIETLLSQSDQLFDKHIGYYNTYVPRNLVRRASIKAKYWEAEPYFHFVNEALDRLVIAPELEDKVLVEEYLMSSILRFLVHAEQPFSKHKIELLERFTKLWDSYINQLIVDNKRGILDVEKLTPYTTLALAYVHQYQQDGSQYNLERALQLTEKQNYAALKNKMLAEYPRMENEPLDLKSFLLKNESKLLFERFQNTANGRGNYTLDKYRLDVSRMANTVQRYAADTSLTSLQQIRENLEPGQAVLYYISSENLPQYSACLVVSEAGVEGHLWELKGKIENQQIFEALLNNHVSEFKAISYHNYLNFIEPIEKNLDPKNIRKLKVYPSRLSLYIPYEIIVTDTLGESFSTLSYLADTYQVDYALSASIESYFTNRVTERVGGKKMLAVYPNAAQYDLPSLPFSKKVFDKLSQKFPGRFLSEQEAIYANFTENIEQFDIIQLFAHGESDLLNKQNNKIYLGDKILSLDDVYDLNLDSNPLVVLTGCETGLGENGYAEGGLNFIRAFFYAGSNAVITSFWKIDDYSSAKIIEYFYEYSAKGFPTADALHLAKNKFRETEDELLANPLYWAGLHYTGLNKQLEKATETEFFSGKYLFSGTLFLTLGFIFFVQRRRKRRRTSNVQHSATAL
ncbi:MAG: CHAT domain-containing protein [Luteibaculaceae bacterium]